MKHYTDTNQHTLHTALRRAVMMGVCALAILCTVPTMAQVVIGGNVYGGGNQGELEGNANVELKGGTVKGNVFGGARMADVKGRTYVHINGAAASSALIVKGVYGGNDISGTIATSDEDLPFAISTSKGVDKSWNAFVRATAGNQPVIIGALYGGGNGDYEYTTNTVNNTKYDVTLDDGTYTVDNKPTIEKTYLEINGGIYGSIYGGGNAATVTGQTVIYANNTTAINGTTNRILQAGNEFLGLFAGTDYTLNGDYMVFGYHANRIFGGNNLAEMDIRPTWDLQSIDVNNLYSGGNRGNMTHEKGIIIALQSDNVRVNNVYGGCRMADVNPANTGALAEETLYGYTFPAGYAARVYVTGGKINNVYGGNDISGKVYHGTNVEIHGAISGDIYGGGNGSYAYTDKQDWVNAHPEDADYYYEPGDNSLAALYQKRPHVENTLVHVAGSEGKRVVVTGGLYCGGNSATLDKEGDQSRATATFKIGKYTDIQAVYLGSNGLNMFTEAILQKYANDDFSSLVLTDKDQFATYMEGVTVNIIPNIEWDNNLDYQTRIGSFFCGGNVGSMTYDGIAGHTVNGKRQMEFPQQLVIFDKIVAGCNSANIAEKEGLNAAYTGGLVGSNESGTKVRMLVRSRLQPGYLDIKKNGLFLEEAPYKDNIQGVKVEDANGNAIDANVYVGANVYGGCYASGYVNGGVEINVEDDLISPNADKDILKNTGDYVYASAMAIYGGGYGVGTEIKGNTQINFTKYARVLLAFGGGEMGQVTGNAEVNFDKNLVLPGTEKDSLNAYKAYAGGYAGLITGNTTLNLLGGGVMRAFAGACNAYIEGYATAIVGCTENYGKGLPYVSNAVLGGNDFGGHINGSTQREIEPNNTTTKYVRSQTYVKYMSGNIGEAIYGGSYGSYKYTASDIYTAAPLLNPTFDEKPNKLAGDDNDVILTNTFVDIASQSPYATDIIGSNGSAPVTMIAGGGRGYKGLPKYVNVAQTYVLLHGINRTVPMAHRIYGGGNLSTVSNTMVEAYGGNYGRIFGGTHGVLTVADGDADISYDIVASEINIYDGLNNASMDIFGAGANSGATEKTTINLYGGTMNNVHGGAFTEGYTTETKVNVPASSTAQVNALFGGGLGDEEGRPCDVGTSNIVYASNTNEATVKKGIYGGNHKARVTKQSKITINVPVVNEYGEPQPVYGAGLGELTVSGFTNIDLQNGARVANVYGGGEEGKVYNHYSYYNNTGAISNFYSGTGASKHAHWTNENANNTHIAIEQGAIVTNNVYGGGKGAAAHVSGKTWVNLLGGSVEGDIYGGGDAGAMPRMSSTTHGFMEGQESKQIIATYCQIDGGEVRNVFGGGFKGNTDGNTHVTIGVDGNNSFYEGNPSILRSAYGGGEMAEVTGTSTVDMYNGYIGYTCVDKDQNEFEQLLDLREEGDGLLKENGNLYGAGYGEGAVVMQTYVNLYGGTIRNGLYGGGEIAAVGRGTVIEHENKYVLNTFDAAGKTHVRMYGGKVEGDVFGGGRGFSYDLTGNQVTGKEFYTDGYVFGSTDVEIYRGVIGTDASVAEGHGNVFGGGNIGYVYSQGVKFTGPTTGLLVNGHYYFREDDPNTAAYTTTERTEDCRVHISARCLVTAEEGVTINGDSYAKGEYVTTEDLNTLTYSATEWNRLDTEGLTIRNAVFAGGNVSSGSDKIYANAVTVYGNATAAVVDVYAKDFIRLGGEHVGGLYGDGNLTFVDGYRELNITNYGTDYYNLSETLSYDDYLNKLTDRERDYYSLIYLPQEQINFSYAGVRFYYEKHSEDYPVEVRQSAYETLLTAWKAMMEAKWELNGDSYTAKEAINETNFTYTSGATLTKDEYDTMMAAWTKSMSDKFVIKGECSITAGRMMNTVQRADFCGVFGSRILLHGAQDRVPDVVDYTNYTINRVGEVSFNRVRKGQAGEHGNYFGIYNVVNLLGALTSDVELGHTHQHLNDQGNPTDTKDKDNNVLTYLGYKIANLNNRTKNEGVAGNMVAQASGVFLEIVKSIDENGTKEYGPVTGVIQLDLINVQPGEGGGYVYAKNEHGEPIEIGNVETKKHLILADANTGAITQKAFTYDQNNLQVYQTSGNFIHPQKRIVDDCFPRGGYYTPGEDNYSPAHYWYVRGDFYVYDQYVSAYTGSAQAYPQSVNIPLTITAGSDGKMLLMSVKPNLHAYFVGLPYKSEILTADDKIEINGVTYSMNDPISYWDYSQLPEAERIYFTETMNYVAVCDATVGNTPYKKGHVLKPEEYTTLVTNHPNGYIVEDNNSKEIPTTDVFRITNELSHEAGYLLTFDITNPSIWDDYYTMLDGSSNITKIPENEYNKLDAETQKLYTEAPTLLCTKSGIYGQRSYEMDALVGQAVIDSKNNITTEIWNKYKGGLGQQAEFEQAYVAIGEVWFNYDNKDYHMFKGSYISKTTYDALATTGQTDAQEKFAPAYLCINTIEVADKEYILNGELISDSRYGELKTQSQNSENTFMYGKADKSGELSSYFSQAYVCTTAGKYGGSYFEQTKNYRALEFCDLPKEERNATQNGKPDGDPVFTYNYDALDLLATNFDKDMTKYGEPYYGTQPVDFEATYTVGEDKTVKVKVLDSNGNYTGKIADRELKQGDKLSRIEYESLLNEKSHYFPFVVDNSKATTYYIVSREFQRANIYHPVGKTISEEMYNSLTQDQKNGITQITTSETSYPTGTYYFCVEDFIKNTTGAEVKNGTIIAQSEYDALPNYQVGFMVHGHSPIETSTLYVSRESDIQNLSEDRIITVEYKYTYKESDADGSGYETFVEKHVVNIHVQFKSGLPTIGEVTPPAAVLPNSVVGLSVPSVTKGAYEILGGGWEMFETLSDATEHKNGVAYQNNATPMYWYQNGYYVAYFAKTYLGKAYSNPVPFTIANYHRMGEVMNHEQRMYIDHKDVDRASKIYLDAAPYPSTSIAADYHVTDSPNGKKDGKNDLDYFYDLYKETTDGTLNSNVVNGSNLEFILRSDIAPKKYAGDWKQIGDEAMCFAGTLHGNGYTISGLDKSLFNYLCGNVYNLGVTGSFTGGGVADHGGENGYAENCWVYTDATLPENTSTKAVIGDGGKIINSYYIEDNTYFEGEAIKETKTDFEQGEVAYQLNHFYLHKRYCDNTSSVNTNLYKYHSLNVADNKLTLKDGYYNVEHATHVFAEVARGYVEDYYADGDFIYANGEIPLQNNERFDLTTRKYYPVYPDDYLFFGQRLSYDEATHNDWPVRVAKRTDDQGRERIVRTNEGNRVYRAPAYYMSKNKQEAYFNSNAVFVDKYNDTAVDHNMTAIDFTGYNDSEYDKLTASGVFHTPILDYEGLSGIHIEGLTPNLLVYANTADTKTYNVLSNYLKEPELSIGTSYAEIAPVLQTQMPHGHLVDFTDSKYKATRDHFLVDKENFNAPIPFTYAENQYMWYQRTPDRFAESGSNGWDVISLPFTAGLVTTHQKGEITHFYGDSKTMHEYWLRELNSVVTENSETEATFTRPLAGTTGDYKATNDFLYEYYYSKYGQQDANTDSYQKYYNSNREYPDYVHMTATIPYIVAFPGERYYEFDMSGKFVPQNTATEIGKLDKQVVTMVSAPGTTIGVTDEEEGRTKEVDGYRFVGTYQKENLSNSYLINDAGDSFVSGAESVPFRGYLVKTGGTQAPPKRIFISGAAEENEPIEEITERGLTIYGKNQAIYIESTLEYEAKVTIYSMSGQVVRHVTVQPMSKEIVPVSSRGIYLVNQKKIAVL